MTEREVIKLWVDTWKEAGPELARIRKREITQEMVDKIVAFAFDAKPLLDFGWKIEESLPKSFGN